MSRLMEVVLPEPPVDVEILVRKLATHHPQPVVHPAGGVEAAHGRIDTGQLVPLAPGGEGIRSQLHGRPPSGLKGPVYERLGISTSKWRWKCAR